MKQAKYIILSSISVLTAKYSQCNSFDDYGMKLFDEKKWDNELNYFIKNVLVVKIKEQAEQSGISIFPSDYVEQMSAVVNEFVIDNYSKKISYIGNVDNASGKEFEKICADILRSNGWNINLTKDTGDQGVDIIGYYGNKKAVFQCKKYSSSVGNKAIQEVHSGKVHLNADYAFVVTNNTYTKSAIELSKSTGVRLLHYLELESLKI